MGNPLVKLLNTPPNHLCDIQEENHEVSVKSLTYCHQI